MGEAEEVARARAYQAQQKRQASARRAREQKMKGSRAARAALTKAWSPIVQANRERGRGDGPPLRG